MRSEAFVCADYDVEEKQFKSPHKSRETGDFVVLQFPIRGTATKPP